MNIEKELVEIESDKLDKKTRDSFTLTTLPITQPEEKQAKNTLQYSTILSMKRKVVKRKSLTNIKSDTGKTRHFTPAAQE